MFAFCACASCMPFHADALKDRSLMPPVSVTMHACIALPALAVGVAPPVVGALPQLADASTRPPSATAPTILIPPERRKMISFHVVSPDHGGPSLGSVRRPRRDQSQTGGHSSIALPGRNSVVSVPTRFSPTPYRCGEMPDRLGYRLRDCRVPLGFRPRSACGTPR